MFHYETVDEAGHRESGVVQIDNYLEAAEYVRSNYGMIITLEQVVKKPHFKSSPYTDRQRTYFFKELSTILQSGLTILQALSIIGENKDKATVHVCKQLSVGIANGKKIYQAMEDLPEYFPELCLTLTRAGEESGEFVKMATELADYYEEKSKLNSFIGRVVIYPLMVGAVGFCVFLLFLFVVLPNVGSMYATMRAPMSASLRWLLSLQQFLLNWWGIALLGLLGLGCLLYHYRGKLVLCFLYLPYFRDIYWDILEIRFCKLWALLLSGGIEMLDAINSSALVVTEQKKYLALQQMKIALTQGEDLGLYLQNHKDVFTPIVRAFIMVGNHTGNLVEMLNETVRIKTEMLSGKLAKLKEYLAPVLLLVVAVFIGFVVLSVMQPIFNLFGALPEY